MYEPSLRGNRLLLPSRNSTRYQCHYYVMDSRESGGRTHVRNGMLIYSLQNLVFSKLQGLPAGQDIMVSAFSKSMTSTRAETPASTLPHTLQKHSLPKRKGYLTWPWAANIYPTARQKTNFCKIKSYFLGSSLSFLLPTVTHSARITGYLSVQRWGIESIYAQPWRINITEK